MLRCQTFVLTLLCKHDRTFSKLAGQTWRGSETCKQAGHRGWGCSGSFCVPGDGHLSVSIAWPLALDAAVNAGAMSLRCSDCPRFRQGCFGCFGQLNMAPGNATKLLDSSRCQFCRLMRPRQCSPESKSWPETSKTHVVQSNMRTIGAR